MPSENEKSELERDLEQKRKLAAMGAPPPDVAEAACAMPPQVVPDGVVLGSPEQHSDLLRDIEEEKRRASQGQSTPPKPMQFAVGNEDPGGSDRQQRIQHEQDRKAAVEAAIEARRPKSIPLAEQQTGDPQEDAMRRLEAVRPDAPPSRSIPMLQPARPEQPAAPLNITLGPPPTTISDRTARVNNADGEFRLQRTRIDSLYRRLADIVGDGGSSGARVILARAQTGSTWIPQIVTSGVLSNSPAGATSDTLKKLQGTFPLLGLPDQAGGTSWFMISPSCRLNIVGECTREGTYTAKIIRSINGFDSSSTDPLDDDSFGALPDEVDCIAVNPTEAGRGTHALTAGSPILTRVMGIVYGKDDDTDLPLVMIESYDFQDCGTEDTSPAELAFYAG